jgi:Fic family protein
MFAEGPEGFTGGLSAANYRTITDAAPATATRDLTELVSLGALRKQGELRHTRYYLALPSPLSAAIALIPTTPEIN